jgi:hypothetical protein
MSIDYERARVIHDTAEAELLYPAFRLWGISGFISRPISTPVQLTNKIKYDWWANHTYLTQHASRQITVPYRPSWMASKSQRRLARTAEMGVPLRRCTAGSLATKHRGTILCWSRYGGSPARTQRYESRLTRQGSPDLPGAATPLEAARNGFEFYKTLQSSDGHWSTEYGGEVL